MNIIRKIKIKFSDYKKYKNIEVLLTDIKLFIAMLDIDIEECKIKEDNYIDIKLSDDYGVRVFLKSTNPLLYNALIYFKKYDENTNTQVLEKNAKIMSDIGKIRSFLERKLFLDKNQTTYNISFGETTLSSTELETYNKNIKAELSTKMSSLDLL